MFVERQGHRPCARSHLSAKRWTHIPEQRYKQNVNPPRKKQHFFHGGKIFGISCGVSGKMRTFANKKNVMAEKTYKLSLDQLNDIVSDAVSNALKKLENIEIIDEQAQQPDIKVGEMSDEQYREASHWDIGQTWADTL